MQNKINLLTLFLKRGGVKIVLAISLFLTENLRKLQTFKNFSFLTLIYIYWPLQYFPTYIIIINIICKLRIN